MAFVDFFGNFVRKKDVYLKYSTNEQWTGEYWIDGHKIYQVSYNLGTINAFKKITNIPNFDRNIRYEYSMRASDKISGMNSTVNTDLFVTTGGDVYINTNGNTRYDVVYKNNWITLFKLIDLEVKL